MEVNMIYITLALVFILLITRVITIETFKMNLATLTLFIILITLLFSSVSIKYVNGKKNNSTYNSINNQLNNKSNNLAMNNKMSFNKQTLPPIMIDKKTPFAIDLQLY